MLDQGVSGGHGYSTLMGAGAREEASFLETPRGAVFSVTHIPSRPWAALLICPPLLGELLVNYRREVLLARALASVGIGVQRFHYLGTGHSFGDEGALTLESMIEDARTALGAMRNRIQVERVGFLGTRWGALVSASCARGEERAPLIFWQPVLQAERFIQEAIRARVMRRLRKQQGSKTSEKDEVAELLNRGWLDVLGYRLDQRLYASGLGRSLQEALSGTTGPVFILDFGRRGDPSPAYRRLAAELRARERDATVRNLPKETAVWFSARPPQGKTPAVDVTTTWLRDALMNQVTSK
ncbi:hypothetical protein BH18ACT15_BH18ACT15_03950 [soil metagenome]